MSQAGKQWTLTTHFISLTTFLGHNLQLKCSKDSRVGEEHQEAPLCRKHEVWCQFIDAAIFYYSLIPRKNKQVIFSNRKICSADAGGIVEKNRFQLWIQQHFQSVAVMFLECTAELMIIQCMIHKPHMEHKYLKIKRKKILLLPHFVLCIRDYGLIHIFSNDMYSSIHTHTKHSKQQLGLSPGKIQIKPSPTILDTLEALHVIHCMYRRYSETLRLGSNLSVSCTCSKAPINHM